MSPFAKLIKHDIIEQNSLIERANILNVVLLALNAKFIHSSLALRYIKTYCNDYEDQITLFESSINNYDDEIIKALYKLSPDVLGISCYIWNMSMVTRLIPTIRKILPDTTIILGGPEVSYDGEGLFKTLDIDVVMEGEGEVTWKEYLDYRIKGIGRLSEIDGIIYKEGGEVKRNKKRQPLDLKELPFVYDSLSELEHKIIYYEASRGCPFSCQYCLSSAEHGVRFVPLETVKAHMSYFCDQRVKQVKFVDRTFNTKRDYAIAIWRHLIEHDNGYTNFHFEIAAELITEDMLDLLKDARPGLIQFEIGVQSTNMKVLETIQRKMPFEDIAKVSRKIKEIGNIHQHLDLIAGLPYEDYASFKKSFNDVISLRPEQFQLGFLKLLKGSGLRERAVQYGLIYCDEPPYEILYTDVLSFREMLRLHSIEELLERYYNSERFKNSLEYLFTRFETPFDFFEALSFFWEEKGYDQIQHNKLSYYNKLIEFGEFIEAIEADVLREYIRLDYLLHEPLHEMPALFETYDRTLYKELNNDFLRDDEKVGQVAPHLLKLAPRQRYRITLIERFNYNVWQNHELNDYSTHQKGQTSSCILFDYSFRPVKCTILERGE